MYGEAFDTETPPYAATASWEEPSLVDPGETDAGLQMLLDPLLLCCCCCMILPAECWDWALCACCWVIDAPLLPPSMSLDGAMEPVEAAGELGTGEVEDCDPMLEWF